MGVYSTLSVSRVHALAALAQAEFGHLSDEELGDRLDPFVESALHNVLVTRNPDRGDADVLGGIVGVDFDE